jgi:hypothetical protein
MDKEVCAFLSRSTHLQELDLRYNKLFPKDFSKFFTVLAKDTKLVYLNLSQNLLLEDSKSQEALAAEKEADAEKPKARIGAKKVIEKEVKPKASNRGEGDGVEQDEKNLAPDLA